jgi:signal transduction histidine kinase
VKAIRGVAAVLVLAAAALAPLAGPAGLAYAAAILSMLPALLLPRWPLPVLALMLAGFVASGLTWFDGNAAYLQVVVQDLAVGVVAATSRRRISIPAAALATVVQVGAVGLNLYGNDGVSLTTAGLLALATVTAWLVGWTVRERRRHAETVHAQALADERLRIAREVHDLVAHSIGVIAIQAGVGGRVIDTQPAEARNALATIETTSRETLAGLRRTVAALRGPAPGLADVEALAAVGVRVDVRREGRIRALPADLELAAYRIVQESVTNVARHAGTDACRVVIGYGKSALTVEVVDDGVGHSPPDGQAAQPDSLDAAPPGPFGSLGALGPPAGHAEQRDTQGASPHADRPGSPGPRSPNDRHGPTGPPAGQVERRDTQGGSPHADRPGSPGSLDQPDSLRPPDALGPRGPAVALGPHGPPRAIDGHGIAGMRERARLLGGELTAGPRAEGGFRVAARLPLR